MRHHPALLALVGVSGTAPCTFTDIEMTSELADEDEALVVTLPPGEPFSPVLVELLAPNLIRRVADPEQ